MSSFSNFPKNVLLIPDQARVCPIVVDGTGQKAL